MIIYSDFSHHTLFVRKLKRSDIPFMFEHGESYTNFWVVKNRNDEGAVFMYLGCGKPEAPHQIVVWYRGGKMWCSYRATIKSAIEGAQRDGWLYA